DRTRSGGRAEHAGPGAQRVRRCGGAVPRRAGAAADADRTLLMSKSRPANDRRALSVALVILALATGCRSKPEAEAARVVTVDVAPVLQTQIQRTIRTEGLL